MFTSIIKELLGAKKTESNEISNIKLMMNVKAAMQQLPKKN